MMLAEAGVHQAHSASLLLDRLLAHHDIPASKDASQARTSMQLDWPMQKPAPASNLDGLTAASSDTPNLLSSKLSQSQHDAACTQHPDTGADQDGAASHAAAGLNGLDVHDAVRSHQDASDDWQLQQPDQDPPNLDACYTWDEPSLSKTVSAAMREMWGIPGGFLSSEPSGAFPPLQEQQQWQDSETTWSSPEPASGLESPARPANEGDDSPRHDGNILHDGQIVGSTVPSSPEPGNICLDFRHAAANPADDASSSSIRDLDGQATAASDPRPCPQSGPVADMAASALHQNSELHGELHEQAAVVSGASDSVSLHAAADLQIPGVSSTDPASLGVSHAAFDLHEPEAAAAVGQALPAAAQTLIQPDMAAPAASRLQAIPEEADAKATLPSQPCRSTNNHAQQAYGTHPNQPVGPAVPTSSASASQDREAILLDTLEHHLAAIGLLPGQLTSDSPAGASGMQDPPTPAPRDQGSPKMNSPATIPMMRRFSPESHAASPGRMQHLSARTALLLDRLGIGREASLPAASPHKQGPLLLDRLHGQPALMSSFTRYALSQQADAPFSKAHGSPALIDHGDDLDGSHGGQLHQHAADQVQELGTSGGQSIQAAAHSAPDQRAHLKQPVSAMPHEHAIGEAHVGNLIIPSGQPVQATCHGSLDLSEPGGLSNVPEPPQQHAAQQATSHHAAKQDAQRGAALSDPSRPFVSITQPEQIPATSRQRVQHSQPHASLYDLVSNTDRRVSNCQAHEGTQTDQPASVSGLRMSMDDLIHAMHNAQIGGMQPPSRAGLHSTTHGKQIQPHAKIRKGAKRGRSRSALPSQGKRSQSHTLHRQALPDTPHRSARHASPPPFRPAGVADLNPPHQPAGMQRHPKPRGLLQLYMGQPPNQCLRGSSLPPASTSFRPHSRTNDMGATSEVDQGRWQSNEERAAPQQHAAHHQNGMGHDAPSDPQWQHLQQPEQERLGLRANTAGPPVLVKAAVIRDERARSRPTARQLAKGVRDSKCRRLQAQQKAVDLEMQNQVLAKRCKRQSARQQV